jgi:hypothetical protein
LEEAKEGVASEREAFMEYVKLAMSAGKNTKKTAL